MLLPAEISIMLALHAAEKDTLVSGNANLP